MLVKFGYTIVEENGKKTLEDGEQSVYVANGKKIDRRILSVGINDGANIIVKSGLKEGEQVVRSIAIQKKGETEDEGGFHMGPPEPKKR